jgi:hypothetical protein
MDVRVVHPRFVRRVLEVRMPNFGRPQIWVDYLRVTDRPGAVRVDDDDGEDARIVLRSAFNRFPNLEIDGKPVSLGRGFAWYEWIWISLPVLLVLVGGVIGAIVGVITATYNAHVFRTQKSVAAGFGFSAMTSVIGVVVWLAIGNWVQLLIFGPYDQARLERFAGELNAAAPIQLDTDIRRDGARVGPQSFTLDHTLVNQTAGEATGDSRAALNSVVIQDACSEPNVLHMVKNGVKVIYAYRGREGESIAAIPVSSTDCP